MNDKDKELLLSKITKLEENLKNYPHLLDEFPELEKTLSLLHKKVAYDEVLDKQGGFVLFDRGILKDLANFAKHIDMFVSGMQKLSTDSGMASKLLTSEMLHSGSNNIATALEKIKEASDPLFEKAMDVMINHINGITGSINLGELLSQLQKLALKEFELIDTDALKRTTSIDAVKEMNVPVLKKYFFADYEASYENSPSLSVPKAEDFLAVIRDKFVSTYAMSEKDFDADISKWVDHMKNDVAKLLTHQFANCEVAVDLIARDCLTQMNRLSAQHPLFSPLQGAMNKIIMSTSNAEVITLKEFAQKIDPFLDKIKSTSATVITLQNVNEPNYFSNRLIPLVSFSTWVVKSVNTNSPYYITGQPNFSANLTQKLNEWRESIGSSLGVASKTVLEIDGANFSAAKFKTFLLQGFSSLLPEIKTVFEGLTLQDIKLQGHKDISKFNASWESPWRTLVSSIDINSFVLKSASNAPLQSALYTNIYDLLPSQDDILLAFLSCISGKVNKALEEVIRTRKEMHSRFTNVDNNLKQIEGKIDGLTVKVDAIDANVKKLLEGQERILKKLDSLPKGDTNINIDMEVNINNLLDVVVNPNVKIDSKSIVIILNEYLKKFDKEQNYFSFDKNIPLATLYGIFTAYATFKSSMTAKLENRIVGSAIESTGNVTLEGSAGLGLAAFSVLGCSLAAIEGSVIAKLVGEAKAKLALSSNTILEGGLQASLTMNGSAELVFLVAKQRLYEIKSAELNLFLIKTPVYSIGYDVSKWKYLGFSPKGNWQCEMHPDLKAAFKKAYEVLTDVATWAEAGLGKLVDFAGDVADTVVEFGETIVDGVGDFLGGVVDYIW